MSRPVVKFHSLYRCRLIRHSALYVSSESSSHMRWCSRLVRHSLRYISPMRCRSAVKSPPVPRMIPSVPLAYYFLVDPICHIVAVLSEGLFVGPGFVSTSPAFMRINTSHPARLHDWLAQKTIIGPRCLRWEVSPHFAQGLPDHCDSYTACRLCRLEPIQYIHSHL